MNDYMIVIIGSGAMAALVSGIFNLITRWQDRKWSRTDKIQAIDNKLNKCEMDSVRLQMLVMISDYPTEVQEIMKLAEHYFSDLNGNWYMTSIFNKWLEENEIAPPEWFKDK